MSEPNSPTMKGLYEDNYYQDGAKIISELNTPKQMQRGNFYRIIYQQLYGEMTNREAKWTEIEKAYKAEREIVDEDAPNSFIPVIAPIVEGQIAAMIDKNIAVNVKGKGKGDEGFAHVGQMLSDLAFKENKIKQKIKVAGRRYLNFGMGVFSIGWNPDMYNGVGLPEIRTPQITRIFVDGKIKDLLDFQKAEWVIEEIGFKSIDWVRREYGDDMANAVIRLNHVYSFEGKSSYDDINSTSILVVWTRNNKHGNLQKIVMDKRGLILEESDSETPYYDFVDNKYPYFFFGMYQEEGNFYRWGDGSLLLPIQDTINKLYDEVVTACKFNSQPRTFIDPTAQCDVDQFDNDPSHPIIAQKPRENVFVAPAAGMNQIVFQLIQNLMQECEKVTRFSSLMAGNNPAEKMTATQAGIQVNQGNNTVNDKKMDLSDALGDLAQYCIGLFMEFWPAAQALRVSDQREDFEWVDPRQLASVPVMVPVDHNFRKKWMKAHPDSPISEIPKWMQLEDDKGEAQTKQVSFDIDVSVGEGLPTNKVAMYNIILSLAQLMIPDEMTGQPRPLMGYQQVRKMVEDLIGIPLDDALEQAKAMVPQSQPTMAGQGGQSPQQPMNINPSVPGANITGQMGGAPIAI